MLCFAHDGHYHPVVILLCSFGVLVDVHIIAKGVAYVNWVQ